MIFPSVFISGGRVEAEFQDLLTSAADATSYTFSSVSFGSADPRRYIVAYVQVRTSGVIAAASTVTIGGVSATQMGSGSGVFFWIAAVPTGSSGSIEVTRAFASLGCDVAVWSVKRLRSTTPVAVETNMSSAGSTADLTISATSGGCLLGAGLGNGPNIWTGVTEDDEIVIEGGSSFTAATHAVTTTEARAISLTTSGLGVPRMRVLSLR